MKKIYLLAVSTVAVLGGCTRVELMETPLMSEDGKTTAVASFEGQAPTRMTVNDNGSLSWEAEDEFVVFGGGAGNVTFTTTEQNAADGIFSADATPTNDSYAAYYPADDDKSISGSQLSITLAASYSSAKTFKAPMWGKYKDSSVSFKHLGAALEFSYNGIPTGYTTVVVEASKPISGVFTADLSESEPVLATEAALSEANKKVTITIDEGRNDKFYVPLPVGTYDLKVSAFTDNMQDRIELKSWTGLTVERKKLYYTTATYVTVNVEGNNTPYDVSEAIAGITDNSVVDIEGSIDATANDAGSIKLPNVDATYNFTDVPTTSQDKPLTFEEVTDSDGAKVNINMPSTVGDLYAVVNTPKSTVNIEGGTYKSLIATTAENTLIIGEGTTVEELTIIGGNVVIDGGTVGRIDYQNSISITYVINVINSLPEIIDVPEYATAIEIKLTEDINTSETYVLSGTKEITLNGNGHTLTSSAGRAINVSGAKKATIKNLTINASGERAINIIQSNSESKKEVIIDNVTATAANYTVNVASSAPGAKVTINNSTLDGLNVVNVASAGAVVAVTNSTINCNDNNTTEGESYAALCLNKDAIEGTITAEDCTINVTEGSDSQKARNGAEGGEVTIDGSAAGVSVMVAAITYEGSNYYHSFETLAKAIEFAKVGNTITLIRDITLTEGITVNADKVIALDLNGKTISQTSDTPVSMITNNGNLTIKDSSNGSGKIAFTFNGTVDNSIAANAISNTGTLVVKGGEISNAGTGDQIGYAIDNYNGSTLTVDGGKISASGSSYYYGIRLSCGNNPTTVTVNDGEISTIWAQNPSENKATEVKGTVIINGGTVVGTIKYENYTTVKVKKSVTATVTPYGAGKDNTTSAEEGEYTVYSFVHYN